MNAERVAASRQRQQTGGRPASEPQRDASRARSASQTRRERLRFSTSLLAASPASGAALDHVGLDWFFFFLFFIHVPKCSFLFSFTCALFFFYRIACRRHPLSSGRLEPSGELFFPGENNRVSTGELGDIFGRAATLSS